MEEISTLKLAWGVFCALAGAAVGGYLGLSMGIVGAVICAILGAAAGSIVAFNPLEVIAGLLKLL
jgi:outer membrane lipoprotein SlyB